MALFSKPPAKKPAASDNARAQAQARSTPARDVAQAKRGAKASRSDRAPSPGPATLTGASLIEWTPRVRRDRGRARPIPVCARSSRMPRCCTRRARAACARNAGRGHPERSRHPAVAARVAGDVRSPAAGEPARGLRPACPAVRRAVRALCSRLGGAAVNAVPGRAAAGGYVALAGTLTASSATQLDGLRRAIEKRGAERAARPVVGALVSTTRARDCSPICWDRRAPPHRACRRAAREAERAGGRNGQTRQGRRAGRVAAVARAPAVANTAGGVRRSCRRICRGVRAVAALVGAAARRCRLPPPRRPRWCRRARLSMREAFPLAGVLAGSTAPQIAAFAKYAHGRDIVVVDLTAVDRIDFVCAGALLNAIGRVEAAAQGRADRRRVADHPRAAAADRRLAAPFPQEDRVETRLVGVR